jgi:NAD(P)-dependent dehydrogenase (short-subunit alcohol dehydrogenase family)
MPTYLEQLFGLSGQVAVVIGGTGVLGGALAEGLAQAGAKVVVAGRSREKGDERVRAIENLNGWAKFFSVDVAQRDAIEQLLDSVLNDLGRVDMLINGAGVNSASPYLDVKDEDWDRVLSSNLTSVHWGCQIFGGHMAQAADGGSILNIASVTSHLRRRWLISRRTWPANWRRRTCGSTHSAPASFQPSRTARSWTLIALKAS